MKKVFLFFAAVCCSLAITAETLNGTCGDNLTWSLDTETGALVISGTGDMTAYAASSDVPWAEHASGIQTISLPAGLTSIGDRAFMNCSLLQSIDIPATVSVIGRSAFNKCTSLQSAVIPEGVTTLYYVFGGCTSLQSVTLPSTFAVLDEYVFYNCSALQSITLPDNLASIKTSAFSGSGITSIDIPASVTTLGNYAFMNCKSLESVTIHAPIASFGSGVFRDCSALRSAILEGGANVESNMFSGCTALESVTLTEGVQTIKQGAFYDCSSLTTINFPASVDSIGYQAFYNCTSLTTVDLPASVTAIYNQAFRGCTALTDVNNPNGCMKIYEYAFKDCSSLTAISGVGNTTGTRPFEGATALENVSFSSNATIIGAGAFSTCAALKLITLPASIDSIGRDAFSGCNSLKRIKVLNPVPPRLAWRAIYNLQQLAHINVPDESVEAYKAAWTDHASIISGFSTGIIDEGSCGTNMTWTMYENGKLVITGTGFMASYANADEVPWAAYRELITEVEIGNLVNTINQYAFVSCPNLASFSIPTISNYYQIIDGMLVAYSTTTSSFSALVRYPSAKAGASLDLPAAIKSIGSYAFEGCANLTSITLHEAVSGFGYNTFENCVNLASINLPATITEIPRAMFKNCAALASIEIPSTVEIIDQEAFYGCASLTTVNLPAGLQSLGNRVFTQCASMQAFTVEEGCDNFAAVDGALYYTEHSIIAYPMGKEAGFCTLPAYVRAIRESAFDGCTNVLGIYANPTTPPTVNANAFRGVDKSIPVIVPEGKAADYQAAEGWSEFTNISSKMAPVVTAPTAIEGLVYSGVAQTLVNAGSVVGGTMQYSVDGVNYSAALPEGINAGNYFVYYKVIGDATHTDMAPQHFNVAIAKADPVVTAPTAIEGLVYTGEAQVLINAGTTTGGTLTYTQYGTFQPQLPSGINAGTYIINYRVQGDNNFNDSEVGEVQVTIAKAQSTVELAPTAVAGLTFDGQSHELMLAGWGTGGEMRYSFDGVNFTNSILTGTAAETYTIYYKIFGDDNHEDTEMQSFTAVIAKAAPTYTAPTATEGLVYAGYEQVLIAAGGAEGGAMQYSLDGENYSADVPVAANAGQYTVYYRVVGDENHSDIAPQTIVAEIAKADASVATAPTAVAGLKYTGEAQVLIVAGEANGGEMVYSLDGENFAAELPAATESGDYTVYYKVLGDANHNDVAAQTIEAYIQSTVGFEMVNSADKATKILRNGQIYILRGEKIFTVTGQLVE